jgi:hypothetical protein
MLRAGVGRRMLARALGRSPLIRALDLIFEGAAFLDPRVTFSRTTNATVTGPDGLIAYAPHNLLTFSEQFDNAAWVKTRATITANAIAAPDGTLTADALIENTDDNTHFTAGGGTFVSGATYTLTVYAKQGTRNWIRVAFTSLFFPINGRSAVFDLTSGLTGQVQSGVTASISAVGNGWYRCAISAAAASSGTNAEACIFSLQTQNTAAPDPYIGDGTSGIYLWGAQLEQSSTARAYNATTVKNLLGFTEHFDNAAWTKSNSFVQTNLLLQSEAFDTASWNNTRSSITANIVVAPDGTMTGDKLVENTDTNAHLITQVVPLGGSVDSSAYNISVYVKAGERTRIRLRDVQQTTTGSTTFDLITGTVVTGTGTITAAGNDWYRCTIFPLKNNSTSSGVEFTLVESGTTVSYTGDGTSGIFLWGAQLVQGTTPGDYKATTSAAAAVGYTDIYGQPFAQKLVESAVSGVHATAQTVTVVDGTTYTYSFYAKADGRTRIRVRFGTSGTGGSFLGSADFDLSNGTVISSSDLTSSSITPVGNDWYRCACTDVASGTALGCAVFLVEGGTNNYTGDGTSGIYIFGAQLSDSASVDPYAYQPVAAPTSTAYYGPRFHYDPVTLAPKGLLIEEQRTNLVTYSEQFDNGYWSKTRSSITANTIAAPDGTLTADKLIEDTTASNLHYASSSTLTALNGAHTATVFAKFSERNLQIVAIGGTTPRGCGFNLSTGATFNESVGGPIQADLTCDMTFVGDGWWRCRMSWTADGQTAIWFLTSNGNTASYTGDGTSGLYLWGAQLEVGAFPTSYIPTVASQVTRAADSASMIGNNFARWYRQDEGTFYAQASSFGDAPVRYMTFASDATNSNRIAQYFSAGGTNGLVTAGGTSQATMSIGGTTESKVSLAYETDNFAFARNAVVSTDSAGTVPVGLSQIQIGAGVSAATSSLNGTIKRISYYNRRLANTELQAITS